MHTPTDLTRVHLTRGTSGGPRLVTTTGFLSARVVATGAGSASVVLVATRAALLGGDHVRLEVVVDEGLRLELADAAATVAYDGRGAPASWQATMSVGADAGLVWRGEPFVVSAGACVRRDVVGSVAAGGRLLLRETTVLGRSGECGGSLVSRSRLDCAGLPALVETLDLRPGSRGVGVLGPYRVLDQVLALGWRPAPVVDAGSSFALAAPGGLYRRLLGSTHESDCEGVFEAWDIRGNCPTPSREG